MKPEDLNSNEVIKKRPGVLKGLLGFVNLVILILLIRWIVFEVFLIPSGSMYPKLFVNDFIVVSKVDFGIRIPFTQKWALGPYLPPRAAITVFKDPDDSKYLIKRIVGLPNDKLEVIEDFIVSINGERVVHEKIVGDEKEKLAQNMNRSVDSFSAFYEKVSGNEPYIILSSVHAKHPDEMSDQEHAQMMESFEVPKEYILFMGDNRSNSFDGRRFGYVEAKRLVGRARFIALSCEKNIVMRSGCNLSTLRPDRLGDYIAH